ncbi:MAG: leucine-rich repeat domain-containing protein, partial [Hominimerdicola sp.]
PRKIKNKNVTAIKSLNNFSNSFAKVKKIHIPSTVKVIKSTSVDELEYLQEIKVDKKNKKYSSKDGVLFNKKKTVLYSYPRCKSNSTYTVPYTVVRIDNKSFSRSLVKSVKMYNNVNKIGNGAFYFSRYLSNVTLSKNLTFIGKEAFCSTSISKITIPSTVTRIGTNALGLWSAGGSTGHVFLNNCTIMGKNYSTAYWYAMYNKIPFVAI